MITIELKDEKDAQSLCDTFASRNDVGGWRVSRNRQCVTVNVGRDREGISRISNVLTQHVIAEKEDDMLLDIITSDFLFEDRNEQEQILAITKSIIQGKKPDLPGLDRMSSRKQLIYDAFFGFLRDEASFFYESFIRFRLRPYQECLEHYVGMAIDEYKLEQEYQNFVENLRALLKRRRPLMKTVHLVFNKEFALYDRLYHRIDEKQIQRRLDPGLSGKWGMDIEPSVLVSLISIAPRTIFLYTDNVDAGMIQTIQNVFQERVVICPARSCDFHSYGIR